MKTNGITDGPVLLLGGRSEIGLEVARRQFPAAGSRRQVGRRPDDEMTTDRFREYPCLDDE